MAFLIVGSPSRTGQWLDRVGRKRRTGGLTEAEVYATIDALGDVGAALSGGRPEKLATLYRELRLDLRYDNEKGTVVVTVSPRVVNVCVRGRSYSLSTRLILD
ncbi:hypothetical protein [Amycolatopsis sp. CA-230715]|uniref:hypothetical protein n=1 Tax=Amycolatopsis sp. CA-230715 TaxID=2745196 RepID=UPI001C0390EB|nr:hypothetical protein [Amycolatopsis sp. CA-230715]QWF84960.1 hypothetical protein HUW46_08412 [Amycolatopsis sp. CA-230715]